MRRYAGLRPAAAGAAAAGAADAAVAAALIGWTHRRRPAWSDWTAIAESPSAAVRPWSSPRLRPRNRPSSSRCPRRRRSSTKSLTRRALRLQQLRDRLLAVALDERLAEQRHLGQELGDARPRPSSRRCSAGLPDSAACAAAIVRSVAIDVGGDACSRDTADRLDRARRASRGPCRACSSPPVDVDQHADLAAAVHVRRELARRGAAREAADRQVLADLLHERRRGAPRRCRPRRASARRARRRRPDRRARRAARARSRTRGNRRSCATKSVSQFTSTIAPSSRPARRTVPITPSAATRPAAFDAFAPLLMRSSSSAFARSPPRLGQRLLAFHHAEPGALAQVHHHACGNFRHVVAPVALLGRMRRAGGPPRPTSRAPAPSIAPAHAPARNRRRPRPSRRPSTSTNSSPACTISWIDVAACPRASRRRRRARTGGSRGSSRRCPESRARCRSANGWCRRRRRSGCRASSPR